MTDATVTPDALDEGVVAYGANGEKVVGTMRVMDEYSLEERRIGTWIDGRPVYRRVYKTAVPTSLSMSALFAVNDVNIRECVHIYGMELRDYGGYYGVMTSMNFYYSSDDYISVWIDRGTVYATYAGAHHAKNLLYVIIEYTKTTDQPDSAKVQQIEDMKLSSINVSINVDAETRATSALSEI